MGRAARVLPPSARALHRTHVGRCPRRLRRRRCARGVADSPPVPGSSSAQAQGCKARWHERGVGVGRGGWALAPSVCGPACQRSMTQGLSTPSLGAGRERRAGDAGGEGGALGPWNASQAAWTGCRVTARTGICWGEGRWGRGGGGGDAPRGAQRVAGGGSLGTARPRFWSTTGKDGGGCLQASRMGALFCDVVGAWGLQVGGGGRGPRSPGHSSKRRGQVTHRARRARSDRVAICARHSPTASLLGCL